MCGICGVYTPFGGTEDDVAATRQMMKSLEHRGPDGDGIWSAGSAVLGHRRLAIIDLEGGWQPIFNEERNIGVVFNGEIYNYKDLRRDLVSAGHSFTTQSDTEVIVHGYEEWADDFVSRLRGMFAFAIYDSPRRRMLLGRDRLGIKPLYTADDGRRFIFASEIKSLLAAGIPREVNSARLAEYLAFRTVAGEETLLKGIFEIEPGTLLALEGDRRIVKRYWMPQRFERTPQNGSAIVRGREMLTDAVRSRLASDVPLGTITSGGLDSSLVSAIAAHLIAGPIDTFCVGFGEPGFDERPFARIVASQIGSGHHEIEVSAADIDRNLDLLTWAHDEPLSHPNSIPMHLIFREAKERADVTVLVSGEGADEVFGGYEWYSVSSRRDALRRMPFISTLGKIAPPFGKMATLKRVLREDYLIGASAVSSAGEVSSLLPAAASALSGRERFWTADRTTAGLFLYDQRTYLPALLQRQDRMSMAAGVEARVPFLDHHLVEWANSLTANEKLPGGGRKGLLKSIASGWLPSGIINRKKVGFEMPLGEWMRKGGPLSARVHGLLSSNSFASEVADPKRVRSLIQQHDSRQADHGNVLWSLIALETWASIFLRSRVHEFRLPGAETGKDYSKVRRALCAV
ncbi:MAG TPA: asparagine synthase (glutamine-hydrolyzing) [Blastocatellia bacterium]|nr:asparagine synthase (glutamine-hydrolyzing) [Blastocatellia bacterium]